MRAILQALLGSAMLVASSALALAQPPAPAAPALTGCGVGMVLMVPDPAGGLSDAIARNLALAFQKVRAFRT